MKYNKWVYYHFLKKDFKIGYVNNINILKAILSRNFWVFNIKFALLLDFLLFTKFDNTIAKANSL